MIDQSGISKNLSDPRELALAALTLWRDLERTVNGELEWIDNGEHIDLTDALAAYIDARWPQLGSCIPAYTLVSSLTDDDNDPAILARWLTYFDNAIVWATAELQRGRIETAITHHPRRQRSDP